MMRDRLEELEKDGRGKPAGKQFEGLRSGERCACGIDPG